MVTHECLFFFFFGKIGSQKIFAICVFVPADESCRNVYIVNTISCAKSIWGCIPSFYVLILQIRKNIILIHVERTQSRREPMKFRFCTCCISGRTYHTVMFQSELHVRVPLMTTVYTTARGEANKRPKQHDALQSPTFLSYRAKF